MLFGTERLKAGRPCRRACVRAALGASVGAGAWRCRIVVILAILDLHGRLKCGVVRRRHAGWHGGCRADVREGRRDAGRKPRLGSGAGGFVAGRYRLMES